MQNPRPITFTPEYIQKYWEGPQNIVVRYYAYLQRGFGLVNEAKNYIFIMFGSYWTVKSISLLGFSLDPAWIIVAGILGLPVLVFLGRWYLFKAQKSAEYINTQHGSLTGFNPYNMQILQIALLTGIAKKLGVDVDDLYKHLND